MIHFPLHRADRGPVQGRPVGGLFPGLDPDRQAVLRRGQRAGGEVGEGAREVDRPVEVQGHVPLLVGWVHKDHPVRGVGSDPRGGVGEEDDQAARCLATKGRQGEGLAAVVELDLTGGFIDVLDALDRGADGDRAGLLKRRYRPTKAQRGFGR